MDQNNTPATKFSLPSELLDRVDARIAKERGITLPTSRPKDQQPQQETNPQQPEPLPEWGTQGVMGLVNSVGSGAMEAVFQTRDLLLGEEPDDQKGAFRRQHEADRAQLKAAGWGNSLAADISQFGIGLVGAGKLMAPVSALNKVKQSGAVGRTAWEIGRGMLAGFATLDPHEERLSNLIQQYEPLRNPISEYLAAKPGESAIEGRFKNALEGMGMDLALIGVLEASLRAIRAVRGGDEAGAKAALQEVEQLQVQRDADVAAREAVEGGSKSVDTEAKELVEAASKSPEASTSMPTGERRVADVQIEPVRSEAEAVPPRPHHEAINSSPATSPVPPVRHSAAPEVDLMSVLDNSRADLAAIRTYGTRSEASLNGHRFSDHTPLPWTRLRGTEEVRAFAEQAASALSERLSAAKGGDVLSDLRVQEMVQQRASLFNEDPAEVMAELVQAGERANDLVANMEASFLLSQRFLQDSFTLSTKYKMGNLAEWGGDAALAGKELQARIAAAYDLLGAAMSMRAASGRAMRRMRSEFQITPDDLERLKDVPPEKLADLLYSTQGDLKKLVQMANPSIMRRLLDEATFSLTNSLLWMWPTHAVNLTSNLYMLAARPTEKVLGSLAMGQAGSAVRRQAMKEYGYTVASIADGWSAMMEAFKRGDSVISPYGAEYTSSLRIPQPNLNWKPIHSMSDIVENGWKALNYRTLVGLPTRSLGAVDEFMKTLRYRAVVQAKASVEAAEQGLTGGELQAFIERRLADAFDADGRAIDAAAIKEAETATFQQELLSGTAGKAIQSFRENLPVTALILPFVKTPINVLRYAWKMTPGLNLLQKEYREMLRGKIGTEAQAHAIGQVALGATFMALAGTLAASGRLTGSGPKDPALLASLKATGWQPNSLTWEDGNGERHYFFLGRFDPIALPMVMVADLVDLQRMGASDHQVASASATVALSLAKSFEDRTFLQNLNAALQAASDPENRLQRYVGQTAGNAMPFSSLLREVNPDPYMRETRSFIDSILSKVPAFSEGLPPARDAFGEPRWQRIGLATREDADVVEAEHNRIILDTGHGLRLPDPVRNGVDLRTVTLSNGRNAYDLFQEYVATPPSGPGLKTTLSKLIQSDGYARLVDGDPSARGTKLGAMMDVVVRYREAAMARLRAEFPELRAALSQRQLDVTGRLKEKQTEAAKPTDTEALLKALGY